MKKKRLIALILSLLLAGGGVAYAVTAGTASDPLVSLSYALGLYTQSALNQANTAINNALSPIRNSAAAVAGGNTGSFQTYSFQAGGSVNLTLGGSLTLLSGSARLTVRTGEVINVSTGVVTASGSQLAVGNRYLGAEGSSAAVTFLSDGRAALDGGAQVVSAGGQAPVFSDVPVTHWAYDYVTKLASLGLVNGVGNGKFNPDAQITRGDFVTILGRLQGIDPTQYMGASFSDVSATAYYAPSIAWASASGLVNGYGDGTFAPTAQITRQEMATIIARYAAFDNRPLQDGSSSARFADDGAIASWASAAVYSARVAGLINGKDSNKFDPAGNATRAEICAIIARYIG
ncbi:MAG: S-layer homology domain-containing protein [Firmicutes bacterium]|nr:S-layer homology domain-containing protein [Bacillota bacterium]